MYIEKNSHSNNKDFYEKVSLPFIYIKANVFLFSFLESISESNDRLQECVNQNSFLHIIYLTTIGNASISMIHSWNVLHVQAEDKRSTAGKIEVLVYMIRTRYIYSYAVWTFYQQSKSVGLIDNSLSE